MNEFQGNPDDYMKTRMPWDKQVPQQGDDEPAQ